MRKRLYLTRITVLTILLFLSLTGISQSCDNWLSLPAKPSFVELGDLDIPGDHITVEAIFNRTAPYSGGNEFAGDIVTKHQTPADVNYLLRPGIAHITTTDGFFSTPEACPVQLNKTYHIAMVYDGTTLSFYRNGFLMGQVAATGNLIQNDWPAQIGVYTGLQVNSDFIGYVNEVRIWNVARTQAQIQAYMNTSLPSPATQTGLMAYYTFDDLTNKQGNAAWNGVLHGNAAIGQQNPTCANFVADNNCCPAIQGTLTGSNACIGSSQGQLTFHASAGTEPFTLTYSDGTNTHIQNNVYNGVPFSVAIPSSATTTYTLISLQDASGCPATVVSGTTADIKVNSCALCTGSLGDPIINITFGSGNNPGQPLPNIVQGASTTLTYVSVSSNPANPIPLDGQYTITNNVPGNSNWFYGMPDHTPNDNNGYMAFYNSSEQPGEFYKQTVNNLCGATTYEFAAWIANALNPAAMAGVNPDITFRIEQTDGTLLASYNTGPIAQNTSFAWKQFGFFFTTPANISTVVLRMVNNNPGGTANVGNDLAIDDITFRPCGPNITASFDINAPMSSRSVCQGSSLTLYGSSSGSYSNPAYLWQFSSDTGKTWNDIPSSNMLQLNITASLTENQQVDYIYRVLTGESDKIGTINCRVSSNLITLTIHPLPEGSLAGENICIGDNGKLLFKAAGGLPPFTISYSDGSSTYIQGNLIDGEYFPTPLPITVNTDFILKSLTDGNGCTNLAQDEVIAAINVNQLPQGGINGGIACEGYSTSLSFAASAGMSPFSISITDGSSVIAIDSVTNGSFIIPNTVNTGNKTYTLLSITDSNGCVRNSGFTSSDASLSILPSPKIIFDPIPAVCKNDNDLIITQIKEISGIPGAGFFSGSRVTPEGLFSPSKLAAGSYPVQYTFTADNGCVDSASQDILVKPAPVPYAGPDLIGCVNASIQLNASGGSVYAWSPPGGLSDPAISNPIATVSATTTYAVVVTNAEGCTAADSLTIIVSPLGKAAYTIANAFTPNGDGKNECFGIQRWAGIELLEFSVYNRWGQRIFFTKNPSECWNGTFRGIPQDTGGYIYVIRAITPCGNVNLKGTVLLIR